MDEEVRTLLKEQRILLEKAVSLSEENHKRIKQIHSTIQRGFYARIAYWVIVLLIAVGAFYAISPMINTIYSQYQTANSFFQNPEKVFSGSTEEGTSPWSLFSELLFGASSEEQTPELQ